MSASESKAKVKGSRTYAVKLAAAAVVANVFAIALAAMALIQSHHLHQQRAAVASQNLAHILDRNFASAIDRIDDALLAVADEAEHRIPGAQARLGAATAVLEHRLKRAPMVQTLLVADAQGHIIHAVGMGTGMLEAPADGVYAERLRNNPDLGMVISAPIYQRHTDSWVLAFARRLRGADGGFGGVVSALVPLEPFTAALTGLDLGADGAVALRDASLAVITRFPRAIAGTGVIGNPAVSQELRDAVAKDPLSGTYVARAGIDGIERTLSYRKIGDRPLFIVVGLASSDYLADWWRELWRNVGLLALFMPMSALAARRIHRTWGQKSMALERASVASARLHAILSNTPVGLAIVDNQRIIREANTALATTFGVDADTLVGSSVRVLYANDEHFIELGVRAYPIVNRGETFCDVVRMMRHGGGELWCRLIGRLVDANDPAQGYVWIFDDVTAQRAADAALRASEERFRLLVDGVRDYAIYRLDPAGTVLTWNSGAEAIKGYTADEIIGQSFTAFYTPEDVVAAVPQRALSVAAAIGRFEGEGWRVRKDGSCFWASVVISALRDDAGEVTGYAKITRDIGERRRAEAEIRRLVSYQQAILHNTPVGIAIVSLDRTVLNANDAFCRIYGRDGETLGGQPASILYGDPEQFEEVGRRAYAEVREGGTFTDDVLMCRRDGSRVWVHLVAHMVDVDQPELGVVWAAEDISALKEMHDNLVRSNADLERFAYVASHDLRQPLRMVSSYIGLIERRLKDMQDSELHEFMAYAIDGAKRMDRMIIDLLDYSRIARTSGDFAPVALAEVVGRAVNTLAETAAGANAEIVVAEHLPTVNGVASELERLFQNLLGNALKFRKPDVAPRIEIGCRSGDGEWIVWVSDNGIGIDPAHYDRLFTIFSRLVRQEQYDGTGIGLAACRKIAEHHGGRIWVESQPGQGSTFFVALTAKRLR